MIILSPNHVAPLPKPRGASPQTTWLPLPKPRGCLSPNHVAASPQTTWRLSPNHVAASPQTKPDPTHAAPLLRDHHGGAVWSTETHSLFSENMRWMASCVGSGDGTR